jgi:ubiquinone/menaquinone biosynthesis C-methylase UbiE
MSVYDAVAPAFDRHRRVPDAVLEAIRAAILNALGQVFHPRLLDIGAGTGRIGLPFVAAGDDYVGLDLSLGMLRQFADRARQRGRRLSHLVQADGQHLPFRDAAFDAVMLIQLFGGLRGWRQLLGETRRVLTTAGLVFVGRLVSPECGLDAQMKQRLAFILSELGARSETRNTREDALRWLEAEAHRTDRIIAAAWDVERTPRGFLNRHQTGAYFSALPEPVKKNASRRLSTWAEATFGSLDRVVPERHSFELRVFGFPAQGASQNG